MVSSLTVFHLVCSGGAVFLARSFFYLRHILRGDTTGFLYMFPFSSPWFGSWLSLFFFDASSLFHRMFIIPCRAYRILYNSMPLRWVL